MGELSKITIDGVSYDFKDAGAARQSHSHTKSQITDFPTLGTAASKNVPSSGNASTSQVVMGNDSRLSDARTPTSHTHTKSQITDFPTSMPASDVYSWAKQSSKPSYTAYEVGAIATSAKGAANGVASLDSSGKVPSSQLPSYVDDVLEYSAKSSFPSTGETGKIYVDTTTNKTYRWSGSAYVEISESLALGETSSTAYYGDKGKTAYSHATDSSRLTTAQSSGLYKIATTTQGHIASVTAVTKSDITGLGIPGSDTNTHRPILVNGTQVLGDNSTALNFVGTGHVNVEYDSTNPGTIRFYEDNWLTFVDKEIILGDGSLTWTPSSSSPGLYYSSDIPFYRSGTTPAFSYILGATIMDFNALPNALISVGLSGTSSIWLLSNTNSFQSYTKLKLRTFGLISLGDA